MKAVVFTDYRGLTVAELSELRKILRSDNLEFKIVKNTLARIVSQDTPVSPAKGVFKGPVGVGLSYDDPLQIVKKTLEYAKKNNKLKISGGVFEGRMCSSDEIKAIAELPPMQVLRSMLAGVLQAPLGKMAGACNATISSFAYALEALKNKKEHQ